MGFPGALGLDLSAERGDFPAILKKIEQAVVARGAGGRLGTWPYPPGFAITAGLGELGKRVVEGKARPTSPGDLQACLDKYSPGRTWKGTLLHGPDTGIRARNELLVFMDTYVFGRGYLGTTELAIPRKYNYIW